MCSTAEGGQAGVLASSAPLAAAAAASAPACRSRRAALVVQVRLLGAQQLHVPQPEGSGWPGPQGSPPVCVVDARRRHPAHDGQDLPPRVRRAAQPEWLPLPGHHVHAAGQHWCVHCAAVGVPWGHDVRALRQAQKRACRRGGQALLAAPLPLAAASSPPCRRHPPAPPPPPLGAAPRLPAGQADVGGRLRDRHAHGQPRHDAGRLPLELHGGGDHGRQALPGRAVRHPRRRHPGLPLALPDDQPARAPGEWTEPAGAEQRGLAEAAAQS